MELIFRLRLTDINKQFRRLSVEICSARLQAHAHSHWIKNGWPYHHREMKITADVCHCLPPPPTHWLPHLKPCSLYFLSSSRLPLTSNDNSPLLMLWFAFPHTSFTHFFSSSSSFFLLPQGDPAVTWDYKGSMMPKLSNPTASTGELNSKHLLVYLAHLHLCIATQSLKYFWCLMPSAYLHKWPCKRKGENSCLLHFISPMIKRKDGW